MVVILTRVADFLKLPVKFQKLIVFVFYLTAVNHHSKILRVRAIIRLFT